MPTTPGVELIYFTGCPYVNAAREALRTALSAAGLSLVWQEWDQTAPAAPAHVQGFGSPTVLIDGRDVTGVGAVASAGRACCAGGAPGSELILAVLASALADAM